MAWRKHRQAFLAPQVEVAEPHLLVDQGEQPMDVRVALGRDADVVGAGEVQRLHILAPGKEHAVVAPAAGDLDGDFPLGGPVERPVVRLDDLLDHFERVRVDFVLGPLVSR
jgi:hypothetical protein